MHEEEEFVGPSSTCNLTKRIKSGLEERFEPHSRFFMKGQPNFYFSAAAKSPVSQMGLIGEPTALYSGHSSFRLNKTERSVYQRNCLYPEKVTTPVSNNPGELSLKTLETRILGRVSLRDELAERRQESHGSKSTNNFDSEDRVTRESVQDDRFLLPVSPPAREKMAKCTGKLHIRNQAKPSFKRLERVDTMQTSSSQVEQKFGIHPPSVVEGMRTVIRKVTSSDEPSRKSPKLDLQFRLHPQGGTDGNKSPVSRRFWRVNTDLSESQVRSRRILNATSESPILLSQSATGAKTLQVSLMAEHEEKPFYVKVSNPTQEREGRIKAAAIAQKQFAELKGGNFQESNLRKKRQAVSSEQNAICQDLCKIVQDLKDAGSDGAEFYEMVRDNFGSNSILLEVIFNSEKKFRNLDPKKLHSELFVGKQKDHTGLTPKKPSQLPRTMSKSLNRVKLQIRTARLLGAGQLGAGEYSKLPFLVGFLTDKLNQSRVKQAQKVISEGIRVFTKIADLKDRRAAVILKRTVGEDNSFKPPLLQMGQTLSAEKAMIIRQRYKQMSSKYFSQEENSFTASNKCPDLMQEQNDIWRDAHFLMMEMSERNWITKESLKTLKPIEKISPVKGDIEMALNRL